MENTIPLLVYINSKEELWLNSILQKLSLEQLNMFGYIAWEILKPKPWRQDRVIEKFSLNRIDKSFEFAGYDDPCMDDYYLTQDKIALMMVLVKSKKTRLDLMKEWIDRSPAIASVPENIDIVYCIAEKEADKWSLFSDEVEK